MLELIAVPRGVMEAGIALGFTGSNVNRTDHNPDCISSDFAADHFPLDHAFQGNVGSVDHRNRRIDVRGTYYRGRHLSPLEVFTGVAIIYFLLTYPSPSFSIEYMKSIDRKNDSCKHINPLHQGPSQALWSVTRSARYQPRCEPR